MIVTILIILLVLGLLGGPLWYRGPTPWAWPGPANLVMVILVILLVLALRLAQVLAPGFNQAHDKERADDCTEDN